MDFDGRSSAGKTRMACGSEKSPGSHPRPELWASPSQPELEKPLPTCLHPSPAHRTRASQEGCL